MLHDICSISLYIRWWLTVIVTGVKFFLENQPVYIINVNYILKNALFGIKTVLVMYLRPPMSV